MVFSTSEASIVHASPEDCWRAPGPEATEAEFYRTYSRLGTPTVIFGHIHRPFVRNFAGMPQSVINSGSVGLPYDGDQRASYLLLDDDQPSIRRVEYDIEKEIKALSASGLPGADWTVRILRTGTPQMP